MLEDALEVAPVGIGPGVEAHRRLVQEPAAQGRALLDERQVVGREDGDADHAEQVAGAAQALLVDEDPIPPARRQLALDGHDPAVGLHHLGADDACEQPSRTRAAPGTPRKLSSVAR